MEPKKRLKSWSRERLALSDLWFDRRSVTCRHMFPCRALDGSQRSSVRQPPPPVGEGASIPPGARSNPSTGRALTPTWG